MYHLLRVVFAIIIACGPFWDAWEASAGNSHGLQSERRENQAWWDDAFSGYVFSGCAPVVPGASLTMAAFACEAYVSDGNELIYVTQAAAAVTIADATPTWVAVHKDRTTAVAGWTRQALTHYLYQQSATKPAEPSGGLIFAKVTVAASVISAIDLFLGSASPIGTVIAAPGSTEVELNALMADNRHIYLPCGIYQISASSGDTGILIDQNNVTFEGAGYCTQLTTAVANTDLNLIEVTGNFVTIKHLRITGTAVAGASDTQGNCIYLKGEASTGIADDVTIAGNTLEQCNMGILAVGNNGSSDHIDRLQVLNNTMLSNVQQQTGLRGIKHARIIGNYVNSAIASEGGLLVNQATALHSEDVLISGNDVQAPNSAISVFRTDGCTISGNRARATVDSSSSTAIALTESDQCTISGNYANGLCAASCIYSADGSVDTVISGNVVGNTSAAGTAINLGAGARGVISGNVVLATPNGIKLDGAGTPQMIVGNNIFDTTVGTCIRVNGNATDGPVLISGNVCKDAATDGISVDTANHVIISNNIVMDSQNSGILLNASDYAVISGNHLIDNGAGNGATDDGLTSWSLTLPPLRGTGLIYWGHRPSRTRH